MSSIMTELLLWKRIMLTLTSQVACTLCTKSVLSDLLKRQEKRSRKKEQRNEYSKSLHICIWFDFLWKLNEVKTGCEERSRVETKQRLDNEEPTVTYQCCIKNWMLLKYESEQETLLHIWFGSENLCSLQWSCLCAISFWLMHAAASVVFRNHNFQPKTKTYLFVWCYIYFVILKRFGRCCCCSRIFAMLLYLSILPEFYSFDRIRYPFHLHQNI